MGVLIFIFDDQKTNVTGAAYNSLTKIASQ